MTDRTGLRMALGALAGVALGAIGVLVLPALLVPGPDTLETQAAAVLPEPAEPEISQPATEAPEPATAGPPAPRTGAPPPADPGPGFDTVRLEPDGSGLVAGHAEPGAAVTVLADEQVVAGAEADEDGNFVAFLSLGTSEDPRALSLRDSDGRPSEETVILAPVAPPPAPEPSPADETPPAGATVAALGPAEAGPAVREATGRATDGLPAAGPALRSLASSAPATDAGPAVIALSEAAISPQAPALAPAPGAVAPLERGQPDAASSGAPITGQGSPSTDLSAPPQRQAPASPPNDAEPRSASAAPGPPEGSDGMETASALAATGPEQAPLAATPDGEGSPTDPAAAQAAGTGSATPVNGPAQGRAEPPDMTVAAPGAPVPGSDDAPFLADAASPADVPGLSPAVPLAPALDAAPQTGPAPTVSPSAPSLPSPEAPQAPGQAAVLLSDAQGIRVLQPALPPGADPEVLATVALDAIAYDGAGEVVLSGRATGGTVRLYLDNRPVGEAAIGPDGQWTAPLADAEPGAVHTLRLDEVDADGEVLSRIETPFRREERAALEAAMADSRAPDQSVALRVVQPGNTLWAIARDRYGEPLMYVQVFEANRDRIRNPDLIYPGQVFFLPEVEAP